MNIFQIQQELLSIFNEIEENGGELTEELASQLEISQDNFRNKCESYANVIKTIKADIAAIDEETKRLAELKKSKTNVIERLSNIMINAIEMFGETSKSGSKFVDYGTGKLSIRNTQKVEVDDDKLEAICDEFSKAFAVERMLGNASNRESFTIEDIIQRCKEHTVINQDDVVNVPQIINSSDLETMNVEVTINTPILELLSDEGYNLMKNIADNGSFKVVPKVDKTSLRYGILSEKDITIGKLVSNKNLLIK